jgi:hypothetical protein
MSNYRGDWIRKSPIYPFTTGDIGVLECWSIGYLFHYSNTPPLHHSRDVHIIFIHQNKTFKLHY